MKYFIACETKSLSTVWGSGLSKRKALSDANKNIKMLLKNSPSPSLKAVQCDYSVIDYVDTFGGYTVPWKLKNNIAYLNTVTTFYK
jgi:hypothetical protein